jgi:hypothetical protein
MEDRLCKQEEYRGYTIKVLFDYDPQSPREWDNLGTIYSNSRRYDPDKHSLGEILNDEETGFSEDFKKNYIWLKIRGYEHSGLTISVSGGYPYNDPWDSGLFGVIAMSKEDAIKNWGKKICTKKVREKALEHLEAEVETLDQYYTGDVYGYVIENEDGDEIDSCWGYFGYEWIDKEMIPECKAIIDNDIRKREEKHCERIEKVKSNIILLIGCTFIDGSNAYRVTNTPLFSMPMIEKATQVKGMIRDNFYNEVKLSDVPEDVLENMVSVIK